MNYQAIFSVALLLLPIILFGMDSDDESSSDRNPLHNSAIYREESLAELKSLLAKKKYDVNEESPYLGTPLCRAIDTKNVATIALLLEHGADPNRIFGKSYGLSITPLGWCIRACAPEITAFLLEKGAKPYVAPEAPHPLFQVLFRNIFKKNQLYNIAVFLRFGTNPLTIKQTDKTLFQYMAHELHVLVENLETMQASYAPDIDRRVKKQTEKIAHYKKAFAALVEYKRLALQFKKNFGVPLEICHRFLHTADYGLNSPLRTTVTNIMAAQRKIMRSPQGSVTQP